jgi:hypothetical protein
MAPPSLTGDPITDAVLPAAVRLIWAVRESNPDAVAEAIADAVEAAGEHGQHALIVVLAAMVPDDLSPTQLLEWQANPDEYLRLRQLGVGALGAARLAKGGAAA